jgi:hypothetical protein
MLCQKQHGGARSEHGAVAERADERGALTLTSLRHDGPGIDEQASLVGRHPDYACVEQGFGAAFIDVDEWRDAPRRHRYVHGGFEDTHTLFSMYLPPAESFGGRVVKHLEGGSGGHETLLMLDIGLGSNWMFDFAFDEFGAILMESNQGHHHDEGLGFHNDVWLFGASAECARFAQWLAPLLYDTPVHHTYVFGASGGGHRSYQCLLHRGDVFDGGVPEVCGVNPGPYWSVQALAIDLLGDQLRDVADRCDAGGGDPFEGLSFEQREAVADLFRMGYPKAAMNQMQTMAAPFTLYNTREYNPGYFADFWNKRGYLGHDDPDRLARRRVKRRATVTEVVSVEEMLGGSPAGMQMMMAGAAPQATAAVKLDVDDPDRLYMSWITVATGEAAGRELVAMSILPGGHIMPFLQESPEMFEGVRPGDEVELDNSDWLAFTHLYKHSVEWNVPGLHAEQGVPDEYDDFAFDGVPIHEQTSEVLYDLNELRPFTSKMIVLACSLDCMIWPTFISPLHRHLRLTQEERADDTLRLWWVENATHGPPEMMGMMGAAGVMDPRVWRTRLVDYAGPARQALLDVAKWVEEGVTPPSDTAYSFSRNQQLQLSPDAGARGGIQPVVSLVVNGGERADVKVGESFHLVGTATQPPGTGRIAVAEVDFASDDTWPYQGRIDGGASEHVEIDVTHAFDAPGVYFPSFRVRAWRDDDHSVVPIQNLARVRVVVTA